MRRTLAVSALSLALLAAYPSLALADAQATSQQAATSQGEAEATSETARLNAWFERKYEEQLQFSPIRMTFLGRKDRYSELDDMSRAAAERQLAWGLAALEEMKSSFDYDALTPDARLSWDLFEYQVESGESAFRFADHQYPFEQMGGMQSTLPTFMIGFHKVEDESAYEAYIARLREAPRAFGQLMDHVRRSAELGIRPPRFAHEGVIEQGSKVITGAPFT